MIFLCLASSDLVCVIILSIWFWYSFLLWDAAAINSPLITHLCASHIEIGDREESVFSLKYVGKDEANLLASFLSVSSEASRRHILYMLCE